MPKVPTRPELKVNALVQYYGSNRMLGEHVGRALAGCSWVGVPFMGGGAELKHIKCRTLVCNDLHNHVINLAMVAADPEHGPRLWRYLRRTLFHSQQLAAAQEACRGMEGATPGGDVAWAAAYFCCAWMARAGDAGTDGEFNGKLSVRWEAGGGDSVKRFRGAVEGLRAWRDILSHATFTCMDFRAFLLKCKDATGHGIYCDAPWPEDGDGYKHKFKEQDHRDLAAKLGEYRQTRVVVRYGDHPLIRELYPEGRWTWVFLTGRNQANKGKSEVLITRN